VAVGDGTRWSLLRDKALGVHGSLVPKVVQKLDCLLTGDQWGYGHARKDGVWMTGVGAAIELECTHKGAMGLSQGGRYVWTCGV
jgi:hypothetical protein